jgi:hypothetical protein
MEGDNEVTRMDRTYWRNIVRLVLLLHVFS